MRYGLYSMGVMSTKPRKVQTVGVFTIVPLANTHLYKIVDNTLGLTVLTGNLGQVTSFLRLRGLKFP